MRIFLCILLFVPLCSCVEEIQFAGEQKVGTLVVDGLLSTNIDSNLVFLIRTSELIKQVFPAEEGAQVLLFDDLGKSEQYQDLGHGKYVLPGENIEVRVGGTYFIEVTTRNGHQYRSDPETILPAPEIDSLSFKLTIEKYIYNETRVLNGSFYNLFANGHLPDNTGHTFLKWDVENVYVMREQNCNPITYPKTCYIKRQINQNQIFLLSGLDYQANSHFTQQVVHQRIDYSFGILTSFYVSQKSLTEAAFNYWNEIALTITSGGTIFESAPAPVLGNIHSISNPDEKVLGYFSAVDEKHALVIVTKGDLGFTNNKLPLCHSDLTLPPEFRPSVCCECLEITNSSLHRPSYWP